MADGKTTNDIFDKLDIIIGVGQDRRNLLSDMLDKLSDVKDKLNDIKELLQP